MVDVDRYTAFGRELLAGQIPYRDYFMEYPPGAIPTFVLPGLADGDHFLLVFKLSMVVCGIATLAFVLAILRELRADRARYVRALGVFACAPLALGPVVLNRYDLWPTALATAGLYALVARRPGITGATLAASFSAKLFTVAAAPVALVRIWTTAGKEGVRRALLSAAAVLAVAFLPFVLIAPGGIGYSAYIQTVRNLHTESLGGSVLMALGSVDLLDVTVVQGKPNSLDLAGGLAESLGALSTVCQLAAIVWVTVSFGRVERASDERLVTAFAASIVAYLAFGKVLSPQYLVWLVPLVPLVRGRAGVIATALLVAALVLTQVENLHGDAFRLLHWPVWFVLVRNLLLVAIFATLMHQLRTGALLPARATLVPQRSTS
jgi:uncharacterized membrane protein